MDSKRINSFIISFVASLTLLFAFSGCATKSTSSGASDPQGERLAQAYHILAKCDRDRNSHIGEAMDLTKKAAKMLGTDVDDDGITDRKEGDCIEHLRTAQEMLRLAHASMPVTGEKKALVTIGAARREVTKALEDEKR